MCPGVPPNILCSEHYVLLKRLSLLRAGQLPASLDAEYRHCYRRTRQNNCKDLSKTRRNKPENRKIWKASSWPNCTHCFDKLFTVLLILWLVEKLVYLLAIERKRISRWTLGWGGWFFCLVGFVFFFSFFFGWTDCGKICVRANGHEQSSV